MTPEAAPRTAARQQLLSDLVEACQSRKPLLPVLLKHGVFREAEAAQPATPVGALDVERCQYRAGWCEKEAGHEGSHYTTYRDGETWTLPADALCGYPGCDKPASDPIHPPKATTTKRSGQHWFEGYTLPAAAPAEGLLEALERLHPKIEHPRHGCCAEPKVCTVPHPPECGGHDHGLARPRWPCLTMRAALARPESAGDSSPEELRDYDSIVGSP